MTPDELRFAQLVLGGAPIPDAGPVTARLIAAGSTVLLDDLTTAMLNLPTGQTIAQGAVALRVQLNLPPVTH